MAKLIALVAALLVGTSALAQAPTAPKPESPPAAAAGSDCEAKAVSKDGKPLVGAAKTSFLKKCKSDAVTAVKAVCETKAVGKDGKPLAGAAKASFLKKCVTDAGVK